MKKYGKYEKRPEPTAVMAETTVNKAGNKQPKVKSMLLQTYFVSLLCLLLCVSMFFGTSYAWFTSEVKNSANEIYVGTLKVGLYKENKDNLTGTSETFNLADGEKGYKLFDSNIRWEPGYTNLETIQVVNEGDLAFKYVMTFTDGALADANGANLGDVAKYFDVWVFAHHNKTYQAPDTYEAITTNADWVNVGTLAEVLGGKTVLSGNMVTVRQDDKADDPTTTNGTDDGVRTVDTYTIALHMNGMAPSSVMGHKISLNVKLVAYQLSSEKDGLDSNAYDSDVVASADAQVLKEALAGVKAVVLASDITLTSADDRVTMKTEVLDGNGKKITYSGEKINDAAVGVVTTSGGKISNLTINGGENGQALYISKLDSDLVVSDCTLSGAYSFNLNSATKNDNAVISFINTKFTSWTSYANVAEHAYFTGCTFSYVLKPCGDTTLTNCTFTTERLDVSALEAGETVTLINCTYNGQLIEKAVLTSDGETVTISESDLIKLDTEKTVVLNVNG